MNNLNNGMNEGLLVGQLNVGRSRAGTDETVDLAVRMGLDVLLVQEPYSYRGVVPAPVKGRDFY